MCNWFYACSWRQSVKDKNEMNIGFPELTNKLVLLCLNNTNT